MASAKAGRLGHTWCVGGKARAQEWVNEGQSGRQWGQRGDTQIIHCLVGHREGSM